MLMTTLYSIFITGIIVIIAYSIQFITDMINIAFYNKFEKDLNKFY